MPEDVSTPTVDMAAVQAEIAKLPQADLVEALTKVRVRQKVQQKRQYAKGTMKQYQLKQRAKFSAMKEQALARPATAPGFANLWEQINAAAEEQAESRLEEIAAVPEEGDGDAEE